MFKKIIVSIFALMLIVGCGNTQSSDDQDIVAEITEPVEVIFWHAMSGAQEDALMKFTNEFNEAHEHITVTLQNQSSYGDLSQKLTASLISPSTLPTITQGYTNWFDKAIDDGLMQDLTSYINHSVIGISDIDDFVEGFMNGSYVDGVQYGLPFNKASEAIFYNVDMLEAFEIEAPTTFDAFIEAAKSVYEQSNGTIVGAGADALHNYYFTQMVDRGHVIDETLDVTSEDSVEVIQMYIDGINDGYLRIAGSDRFLSGPFSNELVAMNIGSTSSESFVKSSVEDRFNVGAVVVPIEKTIQQGTDIFMFSNATAEQKTAAFLYMSYITEAQQQLYWAEQTGYIPVRTSVIESDEYINSGSLIAPIASEITDAMFTIPSNANAVYNEVQIMMEEILSHPELDLTATLAKYQSNIEAHWAGE